MLESLTNKIFTYESAESPVIDQEDIDSLDGSSSFKEAARLLSGAVFLRNPAEQIDIQGENNMVASYKEKLIEIMFPQSFIDTLPAAGVTYELHIHPQLRKTSAIVKCSYEKCGAVQMVWVEAKGYRKPNKDGWLEYVDLSYDNDYSAEDVIPVPAGATLHEVRDMIHKMVCELFPEPITAA